MVRLTSLRQCVWDAFNPLLFQSRAGHAAVHHRFPLSQSRVGHAAAHDSPLLFQRRVGEDFEILEYDHKLKAITRRLRSRMTDAELKLWSRLRRGQLQGVQCYRQKPIGPHVVDFYAPKAGLVVEVDGSQHREPAGMAADAVRERFLVQLGLRVVHFDNLQVLRELDNVVTAIYRIVVNPRAEK